MRLPRPQGCSHGTGTTGITLSAPLQRATSIATIPLKTFVIAPEPEENRLSSGRAVPGCPTGIFFPPSFQGFGAFVWYKQIAMLNPRQVPRLPCYLQPGLQEEASSSNVSVLVLFKVQMAFSTEETPLEQESTVPVGLPWQWGLLAQTHAA